MANQRTMTAPLAIIKVNGIPVGKMKNIRITETFRRGRVMGLGRLNAEEIPALEWEGTLNCGFYLVDFKNHPIDKAIIRAVNNLDEFIDTVLLEENGVQLDILRKKTLSQNATTGIITPQLEVFATISGAFLTRQGFDISEGQISGMDSDFEYTNPILYI